MATRRETTVVYAAGVVQGIALVTFPAASTVFADPAKYDLSSAKYGALFVPQVVAAIAGSISGAGLASRFGTKRVYLAGLAADLVSMTLLLVSSLFASDQAVAYALLLGATASLGAGFGLAVPALNTFAASFHPAGVDRAILVLNGLLGVGTVLAPAFVAVFLGVGFWEGLPITSIILLVALLAASARLPLVVAASEATSSRTAEGIPRRFWIYAAFAVLYGICETVNGNWSQLEVTRELGGSATVASLALTVFWAMVTAGRVGFAAAQRRLPPRVVYHVLPFVVAAAFVLVAALPARQPGLGVLVFGLAGLGCSALLPLTISFGQEELSSFATRLAGGVIAFYQLGYGLAAFGVGPIVDSGVSLSTVFGATAAVAVAMGAWSFAVGARLHQPSGRPARLGHHAD